MATYKVGSLKQLESLIVKHNKARLKRCKKAIVRVAKKGQRYIISFTLPIAFRTLERSLHVEVSEDRIAIVADAPYAEAVEKGSRPHCPPLKPLLEWVILRGAQGLDNEAKPGRHTRGTTTKYHSTDILQQLRLEHASNPNIVAAITVAKKIQHKIALFGTKPHRFMFKALPEIQEMLDRELRMAMEDKVSSSAESATE